MDRAESSDPQSKGQQRMQEHKISIWVGPPAGAGGTRTTLLPDDCMIPATISSLGYTLLFSILCASYSASTTCHPHAMGRNPPSSSLLPLAAWRSRKGEFVWVHPARDRNLSGHRYYLYSGNSSSFVKKPDQSNICWRGSAIYTPTLSHAASAAALSMQVRPRLPLGVVVMSRKVELHLLLFVPGTGGGGASPRPALSG